MSASLFSFLADLTVVLHASFVLFVIAGQVLILIGWMRKWHWTQNFIFRFLHLAAIGYVVLEAWLGITCPLTILEYHLRHLAGEATHGMSFIGYWMHYFLFYTAPDWVFILIYSLFGALVLLTFLRYPPHLPFGSSKKRSKI
ncbi:conserved hypothetical protein, membrane [Candidatus Thiomargarita nelsonii]|uniref:DUF2784 domain-containing protein n=1 Tax=Candidatus Thiomargarita nelsonii TaxID=1003181 RepID=A0A0A6P0A2_9GAMM|nr:conserved hypothetical protein, membrane [Candidatus Thiomargarita nelsonii]